LVTHSRKRMPLHLLRCQGLAVNDYSFALGRLEAGTPSTSAQLGYYCIPSREENSHLSTDLAMTHTYSICERRVDSAHPRMRATRTQIAQLSTTTCSFRNGRFWSEARPHKGFRRRRGSATLRTETRGGRRIGPKDAIYGCTLDNMSATLWKHKKTEPIIAHQGTGEIKGMYCILPMTCVKIS
jgi:phage protein U